MFTIMSKLFSLARLIELPYIVAIPYSNDYPLDMTRIDHLIPSTPSVTQFMTTLLTRECCDVSLVGVER